MVAVVDRAGGHRRSVLMFAAGGTVAFVTVAALSGYEIGADPTSADGDWLWVYVGAAATAFCAYLLGLFGGSRGARLGVVLAVAAAIQLAPLAGPLLLSRDVYSYWDYGRIGALHHANEYVSGPNRFSHDVAYRWVGDGWRRTTSVYGPGFSLASEGWPR
jgi:hypothetical protein